MSSIAVNETLPGIDLEPEVSSHGQAAAQTAVIGSFDTHVQAEQTVKALDTWGFPMRHLSIVSKGYHTEENPIGFYTAVDRVKAWGGAGLLWGSLWGLLFGAFAVWIPGFWPFFEMGPLANLLVTTAEGAVLVGGAAALGAALISLGQTDKGVIKYQRLVKADSFLVIAHGTPDEVKRAKELMRQEKAAETAVSDG